MEALERRELIVAELVDPLRRREVLQPMRAEVAQVAADQRCSGGGHEDLAAVPTRGDSRGAMDVAADIAIVRDEWRA